jgi:Ca-activated chloride channel homolog
VSHFLSRTAAIAGFAALLAPSAPAIAAQGPGQPVELSATLSHGILTQNQRQTVHIRVGLKGLATASSVQRPPMNIAIVIDRSGSMQGPRMAAAREAAMLAIDRLTPRDIISVVAYDDRVDVEVPATKANDPRAIKDRIARLTPRGSTAIWAGLQKGAEEIRKFKAPDRVNKIILLSDGLANVGPSKADDFVRLGRQLAQEGITVSTVGLGTGYNEDLMAGLARSAEGTHKFVAEPADLAQFFSREFDDAQAVVAQDIIIHIDLAPGILPNRALGRSAEINGQRMTFRLSQIIAETEQAVIVAIDVPADRSQASLSLGRVSASFRTLDGTSRETAVNDINVRVSTIASEVESSLDKTVARDVTILTAREDNDEAVKLRDAGRIDDSRRKFEANVRDLDQKASRYGFGSDSAVQQQRAVSEQGAAPAPSAPAAAAADWDKKRKIIKESEANSAGSKLRY